MTNIHNLCPTRASNIEHYELKDMITHCWLHYWLTVHLSKKQNDIFVSLCKYLNTTILSFFLCLQCKSRMKNTIRFNSLWPSPMPNVTLCSDTMLSAIYVFHLQLWRDFVMSGPKQTKTLNYAQQELQSYIALAHSTSNRAMFCAPKRHRGV